MKERIRQALSQSMKAEGSIPAAVLIPIYKISGEYYLILTKRTEEVNYHKGQISFPGGVRQPEDKTLGSTALRESWEEIGLDPKDVEILGELDDIVTATTNYLVSPFVAAIPYPYRFRVNPREVEEIIEVPIAALLDTGSLREEPELRQGKLVPQYFYHYKHWVIWGATARILKQFLEVVSGV